MYIVYICIGIGTVGTPGKEGRGGDRKKGGEEYELDMGGMKGEEGWEENVENMDCNMDCSTSIDHGV